MYRKGVKTPNLLMHKRSEKTISALLILVENVPWQLMALILFLCLLLLTEAVCGLWLKNPPYPNHENKRISEPKRNTQKLTCCAEARDARLWFAWYLAFERCQCSKKQPISCAWKTCHIPNFGGRVKQILVIRIRKHKGCTEEWQGGREQPKQN